ncbi:MAG: helix-turn-helix domain-containing protein [Clostridium sp.]|nr:helix-turn-helix domain-containing protein [Clostridium sp.]
MDIVSRIKQFLNLKGIAVTAFADTCGIPRPTVSQLLNGRNKKVSDELIRKIHDSYPDLSVMWLMFGEGQMLVDAPAKAGAQNAVTHTQPEDNNSVVQLSQHEMTFDFSPITDDQEPEPESEPTDNQPSEIAREDQTVDFRDGFQTEEDIDSPSQPKTISFETSNSKRIVNIIVYYSDNSYESFGPLN